MIFNDKDEKYYFRIKRNHFKRKYSYGSKFLFLNNSPINVTVKWLKTNNDIKDKLACWKGFDYNISFLVTNIKKFNTDNFLMNVDIVYVDLSYKVVSIFINVKPETKLNFLNNFGHIFIFCANTINVYGIEIGATLFTAER